MNKDKCECCQSQNIKQKMGHDCYSHYQCGNCGFEFFINEAIRVSGNTYEKDSDYNDDLAVSGNYNDLLGWNHCMALNFVMANYKNEKIATLDVGCFNGFFVKKIGDMGHESYGIDFNRKAIEYGISVYGLEGRIFTKSLVELSGESRRYDLITLFEVIEHLEFPREFLDEIKKILKDKGVIIMSAPNNNMFWRPPLDFPPHHFSRFYPRTLIALVKSCGFKPIRIFEQMSIQDLARNYLGKFFRGRDKKSLRGGEFKNKGVTNLLRRILNRHKKMFGIILWPANKIFYMLGMRYISQVVIARKDNETA